MLVELASRGPDLGAGLTFRLGREQGNACGISLQLR